MKILLIGGTAQGKTQIAKQRFELSDAQVADGSTIELSQLPDLSAINHLHRLIYRMMEENLDPVKELADWTSSSARWLVICDEIGGGIVPVDPFQRQWREATGRICCDLAAEADLVLRVHCGLVQTLKGQES